MAAMASIVRVREWHVTRRALTMVNAMQCTVLPHIAASVFINDDERGLHQDYEKWLEAVCSRLHPAPHTPTIQCRPQGWAGRSVGCTTAPAKLAHGKPLS
jgi:hypothetical protein